MKGWSEDSMSAAIEEVKLGLSVRKSAEKYEVPKSTLSDRVTGRIQSGSKWGKESKLLPQEENEIIDLALSRAERGFGFTKSNFLRYAGVFAKEKGKAFKNDTPTEMWWRRLKGRHPNFALRSPEATATNRHDAMTRERITAYFGSLNGVLEDNGLHQFPERIWNMDETGIQAAHKPPRVLATKGTKTVHGKSSISKETITVIACGNAQGGKIPPHFIIPGKTTKKLYAFDTESCRDGKSPLFGAQFSVSESGWTKNGIGHLWFSHTFIPNIGDERPQILICDGHGSHNNIEFIRLAREESIILVELPSHTSHWTQPFDRSVFKSLKNSWNTNVDNFVKETGVPIGHSLFLRVFGKAWETAVTPENISSGFRATGIYPFNPEAIPETAYKHATATCSSSSLVVDATTPDMALEPPFVEPDDEQRTDPLVAALTFDEDGQQLNTENVSSLITLKLPLLEDGQDPDFTMDLFPETSSQDLSSDIAGETSEVSDEKALEVIESAIDSATLAKFCGGLLAGNDVEDKIFQTWKHYKTKVAEKADAHSRMPNRLSLKLASVSQSKKRKSDAYFVISADDVYFEKLAKEEEKKRKLEEKERKRCEREEKKARKLQVSQHFVGENGPTDKYPDPIPADGSKTTPSRPPVKRRRLESSLREVNSNNKENIQSRSESTDILIPSSHDVVCQTDLLNEDITPVNEVKQLEADRAHLQKQLEEKQKECREEQKKVEQLRRRVDLQQLFTVEDVKVQYGRSDTASLTNENALLLVLCRLRHDMGLKDLAVRFCLSLQSTGIVFNTILDILYFKLGQVSIWPHRDTIISKMTASFRKDFPTSLVIIDGTEFKTQVPHALGLQSQMYSDYKSATTFKALVGCDPSGSVIFISELFTGSISDKAICEESGFFKLLRDLVAQGYIQHGDAVMADKGFKGIELQITKLQKKIKSVSECFSCCIAV